MNVIFHALTSFAITTILCSKQPDSVHGRFTRQLTTLCLGFATGIASHGVLDILPHHYPLRGMTDIVIALILGAAFFVLTKDQHKLLLSICFVGCIIPDIVDLGPALINKYFGMSLPVFKLFPWHWPEYSGSIYDDSRSMESFVSHFVVIAVCIGILLKNGNKLLKPVKYQRKNATA